MYISYRVVMYRKNLDYQKPIITQYLTVFIQFVSSNQIHVIKNEKVYSEKKVY